MSIPQWSAILEVQDPDGRRTRHPFRHPRVQVGRQRGNDLALADEGVSHRHCEFVSAEGFFLVRDLGSHNGTFVNDERVTEKRLRDGDEVRIGATRIRVALQGGVRRPARVRWRGAAIALLVLAGLAAALWPAWKRERDTRQRFLTEVATMQVHDPCAAPQFADLAAVDAQIAGRTIAIGRISKLEEDSDLALLALYRRKLELYPRLSAALEQQEQVEREAQERISRVGLRFWSVKDRKLAVWTQGVLQDREKAADDLLAGVRAMIADTQQLAALIEAVVVRKEAARAQELSDFRFTTDLRALQNACRTAVEKANADAQRPVSALVE
ncbi:MAG TPA: FHA domain-containing protein [Myxococcales bacterium]|nr:FHA domain-containing protein [Myxococcales bacterium]